MFSVCRWNSRLSSGCDYNQAMARGWESKSVEEQQSAASVQAESKQRLTPQEAARKQQEDAINLSRRRILQQLQSVQNTRHRQMLESALSDLDAQLTHLG
jgi:hypothetical protein